MRFFQNPFLIPVEMKNYKKVLGEINRNLAGMADQVTEVVYGFHGSGRKMPAVYREDWWNLLWIIIRKIL